MLRPVLPRRRAVLALSVLFALATAGPAAAQSAPPPAAAPTVDAGTTLVFLVRHAEKAAAPADDPPLDSAGTVRAQALQAMLADAGVQHVIATPRRRTQDTARPLAGALGLTPEIVPLTAGATHIDAVVAAVRRRVGQTVLVVGHSNTIPAIVGALGGPKLSDLCDPQYATLFVLALPASGPPRASRLHYGAPDPAGADRCAAPAMR